MGQCSRKPSTPCFVCYQREQDGIGLYGFVWEVFTQQSLIWLIFSSSLIKSNLAPKLDLSPAKYMAQKR